MRIVSLLPSATEALFALGLGNSLVAVTHECDYPSQVKALPVVTRSTLRLVNEDSAGIEDAVSAVALRGASLYAVDTDAIRELEPDLVVAQDVCHVCAVSADQVVQELAGIRIVRQHPHSLEDVLADIEELAAECAVDSGPLITGLRKRIGKVVEGAARRPRVRGVFLEWLNPPYPAGHWTPDLITLAGLDDPLARAGRPSVAISWDDVIQARPDLLVLAPCGFDKARAEREAAAIECQVKATGARRVVVFDGSAYFNRTRASADRLPGASGGGDGRRLMVRPQATSVPLGAPKLAESSHRVAFQRCSPFHAFGPAPRCAGIASPEGRL